MSEAESPSRAGDAGLWAEAVPCVACGGEQTWPLDAINGFSMLLCRCCGVRFVPPGQLQRVNYDDHYVQAGAYDFYVKDATAIREGRPIRLPRPRQMALEQMARDRAGCVLEIGCGVGTFLHALQQRGITCCGVEPSSKALELAREYLTCELHHGMFHEHVFPGISFDAICLWEVLEHISDVQPFLGKAVTRLARGGAMYLSTPNYGSSWMWQDVPRDPRSRPPVHVTFWDPPSLRMLLERVGLKDVQVKRMGLPVNPGARSGKTLGKYRASIDALLRPSQRRTLYARGVRGITA